MAEPYTTVVGLEVHVQLLTRTKLFCGCPHQFGLPPNSATCPVCLGLPGVAAGHEPPGVRPRPAGGAGAQLRDRRRSPSGTARTTTTPTCRRTTRSASTTCRSATTAGWRSTSTPTRRRATRKRIGIIRAHLEEDAGKLLHDEPAAAATPASISTAPARRCWRSSAAGDEQPRGGGRVPRRDAADAARARRLRLRDAGGQPALRRQRQPPHPAAGRPVAATPIVEIKNLNSFRSVERAIRYEAQRQYEECQKDPANYRIGKLPKTTAGWDDAKGRTEVQRHKEEAADYRYFPDPDLVPVTVIGRSRSTRCAPRWASCRRSSGSGCRRSTGCRAYDAGVLTAMGRTMVAYFEEAAAALGDAQGGVQLDQRPGLPGAHRAQEEIDALPGAGGGVRASSCKADGDGAEPGPAARRSRTCWSTAPTRPRRWRRWGSRRDFDEATLRAAVAAGDRGEPEGGGRLQGRQGGGGEHDQGRGDEGQQGCPERRGPAADGGGVGEGVSGRTFEGRSPSLLTFTGWQRRRLERQFLAEAMDVPRYRLTLALLEVARGKPVAEVPRTLGVSWPGIHNWAGAYAADHHPLGLAEVERSGLAGYYPHRSVRGVTQAARPDGAALRRLGRSKEKLRIARPGTRGGRKNR